MPASALYHPENQRSPLPRRCRAVPAHRLNAPDTWRNTLRALRRDLMRAQISAAQLAIGDDLTEEDCDRIGLVALNVYELLEAIDQVGGAA